MAVSKQTQVNTFNDGMQKDLNPLLTPNTVMTDCLNGTILTYNGNEFALQNDMGNYKFENGKLREGFVPIGIKEHANVLYIVSYNPIEDKVEIGSFPSMKTIEESTLGSSEVDSQTITLESKVNLYTDLASKSKLITLSEIKDDFKLNPGDEYRLVDPVDDDIWKFTSKYIFTENSKLYNIDDYIKTVKSEDDVFSNVTWDVPGWIAIKEIVNTMSEFSAYVDECTHHITFEGDEQVDNKDLIIDLQSVWDGKHYSNDYYGPGMSYPKEKIIDKISNCLSWYYWVPESKNDSITIEEIRQNITSFIGDGLSTNGILSPNGIYNNIYNSLKITTSSDFITIVPYLKIVDKYIIYDQFLTTLKLEKKEFDPNSIIVADQVFKYEVDGDKVNVTFDCYNAENSWLYYNFCRVLDPDNGRDQETDDNLYYVGKWNLYDNPSSINISFSKYFSKTNDDALEIRGNTNYFDKEDIYYLELIFTPENYVWPNDNSTKSIYDDISDSFAKFRFKVYASEIMSYWLNKADNFNNINDSDFIEAMQTLKIKSWISESIDKKIYKLSSNINSFKSNKEVGFDEHLTKINDLINADLSKINIYQKSEGELNVDYGSRYIYRDLEIVDFPKKQDSKTIGRIWRDFVIKDVNGALYDVNGNKFDVSYGMSDSSGEYGNVLKVDVCNNINLTIDSTKLNKRMGRDLLSMDDGSVQSHDDYMIIKKFLCILKDKPYKRKGYKWGWINLYGDADLKFKVNNDYEHDKTWLIESTISTNKGSRTVYINYDKEWHFKPAVDKECDMGDIIDFLKSVCRNDDKLFDKIHITEKYNEWKGVGYEYGVIEEDSWGWIVDSVKSDDTNANSSTTDSVSKNLSDIISGLNVIIYAGTHSEGNAQEMVQFNLNNKKGSGWKQDYAEIVAQANIDNHSNDERYFASIATSNIYDNYVTGYSWENIDKWANNKDENGNNLHFDRIMYLGDSLFTYMLLMWSCRATKSSVRELSEFSFHTLNKFEKNIDEVNIVEEEYNIKMVLHDPPGYLKGISSMISDISISNSCDFAIKNKVDELLIDDIVLDFNSKSQDYIDKFQLISSDSSGYIYIRPDISLGSEINKEIKNIISEMVVGDKISSYSANKNNLVKIRNSNNHWTTVSYLIPFSND